jgi:hypothetical protein
MAGVGVRMAVRLAILAAFVLTVLAAINYGLALLGEARALWLFRDVLGVMS